MPIFATNDGSDCVKRIYIDYLNDCSVSCHFMFLMLYIICQVGLRPDWRLSLWRAATYGLETRRVPGALLSVDDCLRSALDVQATGGAATGNYS